MKHAARHKQCPEIKAGNDEDVAGELRVIAAICKPDEARRYLRYAGLAGEPPARAPPSYESVMLEFDTADPAVETVSDLTPGLTPGLTTQAAEPSWD